MIAENKNTPARPSNPSAIQHGQYLSIGRAASLLGCSVQSLRLWESKGLIKAYRTCNGHGQRRYLVSELKAQVLGVGGGEAPVDEQRKVAIYVRVSSQGQAKEGSLDRQLQRMLATVAEREGIEQGEIKVYRDVASAFGDRSAGLNPMVDTLIEGKIEKIYVEHQDRLSRVPALTRLVEHLAKKNGATIIALDRDTENVDETKNNLLELIEFVTVLANRANGRKAADRKRKVLSPETIEFIRREVAQGRGIKDTVEKANRAGHRTEKGDKLSYRVVGRYLNKVVTKLIPIPESNTFAEFCSQHLKPKTGSKVQAGAIHSSYKLWCRKHRIEPISARKCGDWMRGKGMGHDTRCGYVWYADLEIVGGYPSVFDAKGEWATKFDNGVRGEKLTYQAKKQGQSGLQPTKPVA